MNIKLEENVNKDLLNECPICSSDVDEDGYCPKHNLPVIDWTDSDDDEEKRQKVNNWFARMGW
mgnify:CR=1 FL=1